MNKSTLKVLESISHEIGVVLQEITPDAETHALVDLHRRLKHQSRRLQNLVVTWDVALATEKIRKDPLNTLTSTITLIEERLAALVAATANQEAKVRRLENKYKAAIPKDKGKVEQRIIRSRLILERLRGRSEEAEKTWILIKAHEYPEVNQ